MSVALDEAGQGVDNVWATQDSATKAKEFRALNLFHVEPPCG